MIWTGQVIFGNMYVYTNAYMYAMTLRKSKSKWRGIYGKLWEEDRKGRNVVIKTQFQS